MNRRNHHTKLDADTARVARVSAASFAAQASDLDADESYLEFEARTQRDLRVGSVLREARETAGLGVRELARRAGVDASRISRIESGRTATPSHDVLAALARALGRLPEGLYKLADDLNDDELAGAAPELFDSFMELFPDGASDPEARELGLRKFARLAFLEHDPLAVVVGVPGDRVAPDAEALHEIVGSWGALTDDRKRLVRTFVADQVELSELDRRDRHGASFGFSIELKDRQR